VSWFWAFSFADSDSFFEYDRCARGSVLAAALFGALAIPSSAWLAWRQPSVLRGLAVHAAGPTAPTGVGASGLRPADPEELAQEARSWHI